MLGFPAAGSNEAAASFAEESVSKARASLEFLMKLHHALGDPVILRECCPTSRLRHLLRLHSTKLLLRLYMKEKPLLLATWSGSPAGSTRRMEITASAPVTSGVLGVQLCRNIDRRAECVSASESIRLSVENAAKDETQAWCISAWFRCISASTRVGKLRRHASSRRSTIHKISALWCHIDKYYV